MKKWTCIFLISCLLSVSSGTVSFAADKPDTPIPKIEKSTVEKDAFPIISIDIQLAFAKECPDIGYYANYLVDEKFVTVMIYNGRYIESKAKYSTAKSKKLINAEKLCEDSYSYRPDKPKADYKGYRQRSIIARNNSINAPPEIILST